MEKKEIKLDQNTVKKSETKNDQTSESTKKVDSENDKKIDKKKKTKKEKKKKVLNYFIIMLQFYHYIKISIVIT